MDINNIFHLLTWVVPGYCGIRMYWQVTGLPHQRSSTDTVMASLGWTVACAVPIMLWLGGPPLISPEDVSVKAIGVWLGAIGLTAILGWITGCVRVSRFINTRSPKSAFTSAYDWMNSRPLGDNRRVTVNSTEGIYRGNVAYLDNYSEGGTVVLYDPERKRSDTATFDQMDASALLIPGSRVQWIAQERNSGDA